MGNVSAAAEQKIQCFGSSACHNYCIPHIVLFEARKVKDSSSALSSTSMIILSSIVLLLQSKGEVKCCTLVYGVFRPHTPAVPVDDALDNCQSDLPN